MMDTTTVGNIGRFEFTVDHPVHEDDADLLAGIGNVAGIVQVRQIAAQQIGIE